MKSILTPQSSRRRSRLISLSRALTAVLSLAALAVSSARADVVFTRSSSTGEHFVKYTANYTAPYTGNYAFGFNVTAGGSSGDNSIIIDAVKVTSGATTLFADGFENPALATNTGVSANGGTATYGAWVFTNYSGILNGSPSSWDLAGPASLPSGSPFTLGSADGTSQYGYLQAAGGTLPKMKAANSLALVAGQTYTISFYQASRYSFGGETTYTVTLDIVIPSTLPTVYGSGISTVVGFDPIFPPGYVNPDSAESKPTPTVGYNDSRWLNPHSATVFPLNSHPWEYQSWVPAAFKFSANWINAWANLDSDGHGKTTGIPGWNIPNQSWTKYSTTVFGTGTYVLQFLADNASWIYVDGVLVGFQDYNWPSNGTGRFTINLSGSIPHDLGFVIWDGGGLAGGKFRIETKASFLANNPGATLPPEPATITLSNLTQTYDGSPKSVSYATSPSGLTPTITYNGSTTPPTAAGTYSVVASISTADYLGSTTGTLTINKANVTFALSDLNQRYDGTAKSITVTPSPAGVAYVVNYLGDHTNAGSSGVQVLSNNSNYTGTASDTLVINKASSTTLVTINGGPFTYTGSAQTPATVKVTGVGGLNLTPAASYANNTNAGTATASYAFGGDANHTGSSDSKTFDIAKASSTTVVTINGGPFTYTGSAQTPATVSVTGVGGLSLTPAADYANNTNAGTATASYAFNGDANHTGSSDSKDFTIDKAPSTTVVAISGAPFTYTGSAQTPATVAVTGAGGLSLTPTASYANNTNAGTATASYTFAGDDNHLGSSDSKDFTIDKATSTTVVTINGAPFTYTGAAQTPATVAVTGAGGLSLTPAASYANNTNAGTATASYSFAGDDNHTGSSDSKTFDIAKAPSTTAVTISGAPFTYTGAGQTPATVAVTGVGGLSLTPTASYASNVDAGTATASYTFAGDDNHLGSSDSKNFTIDKAPSATAVTINGGPFTFNGSAQTPATVLVAGAGGLSLAPTASYANNTNAGTATASYSYAGDKNHLGSSDSKNFTIDKAASTTVVTINGTSFTYNGAAQTPATVAVTGAGGLSLTPTAGYANNTNAGTATASYSYTGDANHTGSNDSKNFTINKASTTTTLDTLPAVSALGQSVTLSATVVPVAPGGGSPDGTVTFNLGATVLGTATVNSSGVATLATTALPLGPQSITATYSGSANFIGSAASAKSTLIYGYPTTGGTFVIGDRNAAVGTSVTFWGSQWEKLNTLSGGASNASFKGFASSTAGAAFTTAPGNSAPPAASVPSYLGVIVTSKVTKSGANITGTVTRMVVVKVNPGYAPDPSSAGTGTVVATIP